MAGTVICGNDMAIDGYDTIRAFRIQLNEEASPFVASNTKHGTGRRGGVRKWQGVYSAYGHTPALWPGEQFTFTGSTEGTLGFIGTARVERTRIMWDIEAGKIIEHFVFFKSDGSLALDTAVATDVVQPNPVTSIDMYVKLGDDVQTHIRKMQLDFTCKLKPYVDSSTSGWEMHNKGSIDAAMAWQVYEDAPASLPTLQAEHVAKFYVTATTFWAITWARIVGVDPYELDHESLENVGGWVKAEFNGFSTTEAGSIINPAVATLWPE